MPGKPEAPGVEISPGRPANADSSAVFGWLPLPVRVSMWRWDGVDGGRRLGPEQEYRAGRVVYDEPSVMAETPRSQVGPVAITGDDQQIRVLASLDNLAFHAT